MASLFLDLPTELRQEILLATISDEDLLQAIELQAQPAGNKNGKAKTTFDLSRLPVPSWAYTHSTLAGDLVWLKAQWAAHANVLAAQKKRAWDAIFGERSASFETPN